MERLRCGRLATIVLVAALSLPLSWASESSGRWRRGGRERPASAFG